MLSHNWGQDAIICTNWLLSIFNDTEQQFWDLEKVFCSRFSKTYWKLNWMIQPEPFLCNTPHTLQPVPALGSLQSVEFLACLLLDPVFWSFYSLFGCTCIPPVLQHQALIKGVRKNHPNSVLCYCYSSMEDSVSKSNIIFLWKYSSLIL